jgi:hypothetical protein
MIYIENELSFRVVFIYEDMLLISHTAQKGTHFIWASRTRSHNDTCSMDDADARASLLNHHVAWVEPPVTG